MKNTRLPPDLEAAWEEIEGYAREYGLDFFPIIFEVLDYRTLYETAALGGFPTRYPHWRFGMEYDQLIKGHVWLGSTIYEMVINTNPSYAYLLEGNEMVTQKMVMAHVSAHVDFFKNNMWFAHTNRKMLDDMANHAARVQRMIDRYGYEMVEDFIDICLSLDNLIDYHAPYILRPEAQTHQPIVGDDEPDIVEGLKVDREYMKDYINPPDFLDRQRKHAEEEREKQHRFPENPQKDILLFLLNYAPLERWQHTILEIIRDEAYYFAPQGMTKIMNEGWACLTGEARVYTTSGLRTLAEIVDNRLALLVSDGEHTRTIYDWAKFEDREIVRLRTRRGFRLAGSVTHRVMRADQRWCRLDELAVGDRLRLGPGTAIWTAQGATLDEHQAALLGALVGGGKGDSRAQLELMPEGAAECVPESILRSPRAIVAAFLRGLYDWAGTVDPAGIVLSAQSEAISEVVQLLLLNFGILSNRQRQPDERWQLRIDGRSAVNFQEQIGVVLAHKREALRAYCEHQLEAQAEDWDDEVIAIEHGRADVYDISVERTHRYAAQGLVNHNSYWHSEIMTRKALHAGEIIDFADHHSGVVATQPGRLNPYKLGLELLRDVEDRWNKGKFGKAYDECESIAEKRNWDRQTNLGRQKIFEVRQLYNDVTFIDEFLTPEFVFEQKLFTFRYNRDTDFYEIASREFAEIKEKLLFRLTNFGQPFIYVEDGNYHNRGELYLHHRHEGVDLKIDYARDTMRNIQRIWTRPVHLETMIDDKKRLISFDGKDFSEQKID